MGETLDVAMKGLPINEAVSLFQRELGRALSAEELKAAQAICESLGGMPQRVLRAAHEAREENRSLVAVTPAATILADETLAAAELKPRSEDEKKVLSACAVFMARRLLRNTLPQWPAFPALRRCSRISRSGDWSNLTTISTCWRSDVNNALLANSALVGNLNPWFTRA